jgi:hypothetical protein
MVKKPQFARLARSKTFRNREQAEEWAEDQKETYSRQGLSVKKEIDFNETTSRWSAKIFIKAAGS